MMGSMVGLFMSGVYLITGSLVASMVLHALMDLHAGFVARAALGPEEPAMPAGTAPPVVPADDLVSS